MAHPYCIFVDVPFLLNTLINTVLLQMQSRTCLHALTTSLEFSGLTEDLKNKSIHPAPNLCRQGACN